MAVDFSYASEGARVHGSPSTALSCARLMSGQSAMANRKFITALMRANLVYPQMNEGILIEGFLQYIKMPVQTEVMATTIANHYVEEMLQVAQRAHFAYLSSRPNFKNDEFPHFTISFERMKTLVENERNEVMRIIFDLSLLTRNQVQHLDWIAQDEDIRLVSEMLKSVFSSAEVREAAKEYRELFKVYSKPIVMKKKKFLKVAIQNQIHLLIQNHFQGQEIPYRFSIVAQVVLQRAGRYEYTFSP